jgi:hypothetical protein
VAKLTKIKGNSFTLPKPSPAAVDNGDGTVTFTVPGVGGAAKVILSYGETEDADTVTSDVTVFGSHTTEAYVSSTTVYYKAQGYTAGGVPSGYSTVQNLSVTVV